MERNLIFCFSGTGNSLKAAKDVAAVLGDTEIVLMKGDYKFSGQYSRVGFIFPCYGGGVPMTVLEYIKALEINTDTADYFYGVVTCGGSERDSLPMLRDALLQKGISLNYGSSIPTVGNYIAMYPMAPETGETLRLAEKKTATVVREIKDKAVTTIGKVTLGVKLFYKAGNLYFRSKAKQFTVSDSCISCGMCEKICPTKSIEIKDGKPVFKWQSCSQCMACIQWCHKEAINCGKETGRRTRYHHPDIHADELF